jgi:predicted transcriptional regulator
MPKKTTRYDDAIVIAIESDVKEKLRKLAEDREMGFTQLARLAIKEYFKEELEALDTGQEELFSVINEA